MKAFILAAGLGTRLLPFTKNKPKCLLDVGGKPLLTWQINKLRLFGIKDLIINLFHKGKQIEDLLGDGSELDMRIKYSYEKELLGTGGGIANALDIIGEDPFLMISGDTWSDFDLSTLSLNKGNMAHLILIENPKDKPDGDMFLHRGKVNSKRKGKCLTFSGMALIDPKLFLNVKKSKFELWEEILLPASDQQLVTGELYSGSVININSIEDIKKLDAYLREE